MRPRRVIVHAGFHKTGTTTAQRFLRANGKQIWPRCALVLPKDLHRGASLWAMRYARFGAPADLDRFGDELHAVLSALDVGDRAVLISDEKLSGRMPGRDGHAGYAATPALMARTEAVIRDAFGQTADITFHFSTRDPAAWLRSTYKHNLRTSRLTLDAAEYNATFATAADLGATVQAVAQAVSAKVQSVDLGTLTGPFGPATPLIDLIGLSDQRRARLVPHPMMNIGPPDALIADLLALNRAGLSDDALRTAKSALLNEAIPHD